MAAEQIIPKAIRTLPLRKRGFRIFKSDVQERGFNEISRSIVVIKQLKGTKMF